MLLKTTKHLMKKYICVYFFSKQGILRNHGVFFSYKKSKLQTKLCAQTGHNMFSILVIILQTKHTNYTANTEHRVFIESKHSFSIPVYF